MGGDGLLEGDAGCPLVAGVLEGDGEETIVLVNGLADDLETWVLQVDDFLAAGYRVQPLGNVVRVWPPFSCDEFVRSPATNFLGLPPAERR